MKFNVCKCVPFIPLPTTTNREFICIVTVHLLKHLSILFCRVSDISLPKDSLLGIRELEVLDYIYIKNKTIHIKLKSDLQNRILRLT